MAKMVILFACFAVFNAVSALECYTCDADGCQKDMKQWNKTPCGSSANKDQETVCQKVSFKDKDNKMMVERRCAIVPKTGEAPCPSLPGGSTDPKCPVCKTDLCNSATSVNFSVTALAGVLLAFLGQKYLL